MFDNISIKMMVFLSLFILQSSAFATDKTRHLSIAGWPLDLKDPVNAVLSRDSIVGVLACPSLTRLNLMSRHSEPVLLEKVEESGLVWRLTLNSNLLWWNQTAVTLEELEIFVRQSLLEALGQKKTSSVDLPLFTTSMNHRTLSIKWQAMPRFGPYILNRVAFSKRADDTLGVMCAGEWKAEVFNEGLLLTHAKDLDRNPIFISSKTSPSEASSPDVISFRFGEELVGSKTSVSTKDEPLCNRPLDTPVFTLIAWNPQSSIAHEAKFRRAMTHLIPRGAILRAGAGYLGDLVSAPILRSHPGYKRSLLVPAYDPAKADKLLDELGYRRGKDDGFRHKLNGQPLEIKILVRNQANFGLLGKVLDDGFRALGIKLLFINESQGIPDGILTGIMVSWPEIDLGSWLSSRSNDSSLPWQYSDLALDRALDDYAASLTEFRPNFGLLEKIHDLVYKLAPFSVLMQHKVCVERKWPLKAKAQGLMTLMNPDWFKGLIEE